MYVADNPIALDFETYSDINIGKDGLDNYVNSPYFQPLIACTAQRDGGGGVHELLFDFTNDPDAGRRLRETLKGESIVAHNAAFEQSVLRRMGIEIPSAEFIDTAVLTRAHGYAGSLEASSAQALNQNKMAAGKEFIQMFCIPVKDAGNLWFDVDLPLRHPVEWHEFAEYCALDARLSLYLAERLLDDDTLREMSYSALTMDMNQRGWYVDMDLVKEMAKRYESNSHVFLEDFRNATGARELNLNSSTQLIEWCKKRGVRTSSFDEKHVASMLRRVSAKLIRMTPDDPGYDALSDVQHLLETKRLIGGSSLKKLDTLMRQTGADGRLRNQYLHVGAAATFRTSGRGVQLQNLKRLHGGGDDVNALNDQNVWWPNDKLSNNLRQLFRAKYPNGQLIVGDFSSVESRALAWQAGETWKVHAYSLGKDLYKVQAGMMFGVPYDDVTKEQRQIGKVGELACGYGAGPAAVRDFASKMGLDLSEEETIKLVKDWRDANSTIVQYWYKLDDAMRRAVEHGVDTRVDMGHMRVLFEPILAPESLVQQVDDFSLMSLRFRVMITDAMRPLFTRVIHGTYLDGKQVHYWKPSERKTGDLWTNKYTDPKTKKTRYYSVYGGKLAGLLTQSLCREIFFRSLSKLETRLASWSNARIIGQFHDEIVVEWDGPATSVEEISYAEVISMVKETMSETPLEGFPLAAEVNSAYRYIK